MAVSAAQTDATDAVFIAQPCSPTSLPCPADPYWTLPPGSFWSSNEAWGIEPQQTTRTPASQALFALVCPYACLPVLCLSLCCCHLHPL